MEQERVLPEEVPVNERLVIGICLALVGGFLDAYTYLFRGGVFANAQTGNMVLMSIYAARGCFVKAFYYFIPISAFYLGVLVTEFIKKYFSDRQWAEWQHVVIIVETVLLAIIGFFSKGVPDGVVNVTVAFVCSMQVNSFRKTKGMPYATTMCTGNLRSAAENFFTFLVQKNTLAGAKCARYFVIILMFCIGAALGTILTGLWRERAVWCCCLLLLCVQAVMFWGNERIS